MNIITSVANTIWNAPKNSSLFSPKKSTDPSVSISTVPDDKLLRDLEKSPFDYLIARHLRKEVENSEKELGQIIRTIEIANKDFEGYELNEIAQTTRDIVAKCEAQLQETLTLLDQGYAYDTILLRLKIDRRGLEQIFPANWRQDFPMYPGILFTNPTNDFTDESFMRPLSNNPSASFAAIQAFRQFTEMGQRARERKDCAGHGKSPDAAIKQHIQKYLEFLYNDAGLVNHIGSHSDSKGGIPELIVIMKSRSTEDFHSMQQRIQSKLKKQASRLEALLLQHGQNSYLIDPPTIYGFVIHSGIVTVTSYESLRLNQAFGVFGLFNVNNIQEEDWHTISLAIVIHWVRNNMIRIRDILQPLGNSSFVSQLSSLSLEKVDE